MCITRCRSATRSSITWSSDRTACTRCTCFSPPSPECESVKLENGELVYQPAAERFELAAYRKTIGKLARALSDGIGSKVVVLPVIAVADCPITPSAETLPMVVSLESCTSFVGWKDQRAFLMDDELEEINRWLARQSLETAGDSMREVVGYLDTQVARPALV